MGTGRGNLFAVASMEPGAEIPYHGLCYSKFCRTTFKIGFSKSVPYAWGIAGRKTASLKAALSAWGEPKELIAPFNATMAGLERLAAFYCDLPLGIDERQVVGDKQGFVESPVYPYLD